LKNQYHTTTTYNLQKKNQTDDVSYVQHFHDTMQSKYLGAG